MSARADVIKAFLQKKRATSGARDTYGAGHVASISTDGATLWSYWTTLAVWDGDAVKMNARHYSSTTSRQQNELRAQAERAGVELVEIGAGL